MSEFKGTPGPWRQVSGDMDGAKVFGIAGASQANGFGPVVCAVTLASNVNDEDVANARLIAAAPDLLEALEGALIHDSMGWELPIESMQAAMKKALGQ